MLMTTNWFKSKWAQFVHRMKWKYEDLPQSDRIEAYSYNAPLPTCIITGCPEEMHSSESHVFTYCMRHFNMFESGINVLAVCSHPGCIADIIDVPQKYCNRHSRCP